MARPAPVRAAERTRTRVPAGVVSSFSRQARLKISENSRRFWAEAVH